MTAQEAVNQATEPPLAGMPGARRTAGRLAPLPAWAALAGAFTYILANDPTDTRPDLLGGCGWYAMFHTNGPTCGGTRMVWYLLHGDLVGAARSHLIALIGAPFVLYALIAWTASQTFGIRLPRLKIAWWGYVAYAIVFVV